MIETFLDVETPDGMMPTFIVHPEEHGPHPAIVFFMDAPGMREELREMCRRLASAGYYVMAPQLYYREVREYNVFETGDRDRMFELMSSLSNAMAVSDARVLVKYAESDAAAVADKIGTVGYCMSGSMALMTAAAMPTKVKAAASFHGVRLAVDADDSPHKHLDSVRGQVYVAAAEVDEYAPREMVAEFESALAESGCSGRVEWYPGTEHGFTFRERPQYDKPSSERHWERVHDLFDRNLRR
jgi:carboxymethylenebutenolidase